MAGLGDKETSDDDVEIPALWSQGALVRKPGARKGVKRAKKSSTEAQKDVVDEQARGDAKLAGSVGSELEGGEVRRREGSEEGEIID